jgi:hypothetical protein
MSAPRPAAVKAWLLDLQNRIVRRWRPSTASPSCAMRGSAPKAAAGFRAWKKAM